MKKILFAIVLLLTCGKLFSQNDSAGLMNEASVKLKSKAATVSSILTDKKYLADHPSTAFREIIKQYAPVGRVSIATEEEPGKKIMVTGTLLDGKDKPVKGAIIYMYQTDARGWYSADRPHVEANEGDRRHARLFGYLITDADGKFELLTVKPSGYPNSDLPAHIHIEIEAKGFNNLISELLFDDDPRLEGERRARSVRDGFLVAKPQPATPPLEQLFVYTIKLSAE